MRLSSSDGAFVDLVVTGYQFPNGMELKSGKRVWPDWLWVEGEISTRERAWDFVFPCLYAVEAVELGNWLTEVAHGHLENRRLRFTEPLLRFDVAGRSDDRVLLRLHVAHEACPPEQSEDVRFGDGYPVDLDVDIAALTRAADAWRDEIAPYPARP